MVAIHQKMMGTSDYFAVGRALRLTYFLLSGIYLLVVYALARQMLSPLHSFFVGAITGLSFNSFFYPSETLYADLPFAFVSILFLLCHRKCNSAAHTVAAGGLACAAYLLRTAGIVLLVAWIIESLIRRRWKEATIRAAVAAIPILAWQCYILHGDPDNSHRDFWTSARWLRSADVVNPFAQLGGGSFNIDWLLCGPGGLVAPKPICAHGHKKWSFKLDSAATEVGPGIAA